MELYFAAPGLGNRPRAVTSKRRSYDILAQLSLKKLVTFGLSDALEAFSISFCCRQFARFRSVGSSNVNSVWERPRTRATRLAVAGVSAHSRRHHRLRRNVFVPAYSEKKKNPGSANCDPKSGAGFVDLRDLGEIVSAETSHTANG